MLGQSSETILFFRQIVKNRNRFKDVFILYKKSQYLLDYYRVYNNVKIYYPIVFSILDL